MRAKSSTLCSTSATRCWSNSVSFRLLFFDRRYFRLQRSPLSDGAFRPLRPPSWIDNRLFADHFNGDTCGLFRLENDERHGVFSLVLGPMIFLASVKTVSRYQPFLHGDRSALITFLSTVEKDIWIRTSAYHVFSRLPLNFPKLHLL